MTIEAPPHSAAWIGALSERVPGAVETSPEAIDSNSGDAGWGHPRPPGCVVQPRTRDEVVTALEVAREYAVPVTPAGARQGLEGGAVPSEGGLALNLTRMDRLVELDPGSLTAVVEPGVMRSTLDAAAREQGLQFPIDPGPDASLGGMAATNAGGSNALRYGSMREQVLALEAVLSDGRTVRTGSRARKGSSGYDLKTLLVGSEGTLGVITELTVRLHPLPAARVSARAAFETVGSAVAAAGALVRAGMPLDRVELLDAECVRAVNRHRSTEHAERPSLWIELYGDDPAALDERLEVADRSLSDAGATDVELAREEDEQEELWEARRAAWRAVEALHPDERVVSTDVCVPIGRLAEAVEAAAELMREHTLPGPLLGHVGDGNFHAFLHLRADDTDGWRRLDRLIAALSERAVELGGTCTGEHGVGLRKVPHQAAEHGEALALMQDVKAAFDPLGILNPGKVLPDRGI